MSSASGGIASLDRVQEWCQSTQQHETDGQIDEAAVMASAQPAETAAAAASFAQHKNVQQTSGTWPQGQQQQDHEGIANAFSPAASVVGIRSLPNALHPGYRLELLMKLQAAERQRQQSNAHASSSGQQQQLPQRAGSLQGVNHSSGGGGGGQQQQQQRQLKASASMATAGKMPQRYGPLEGYFSCYQHLTSEYERRELVEKFARLNNKLAQVGTDDFVVRGCPPPCQHSTTFATYPHDLPPYVEVDYLGRPVHNQQQQQQQQQQQRGRPPFIPAGRNSSPDVLLKGLQVDLIAGLEAALSKEWPRSFIKAFVDTEGSVVLSFDRSAAASEGDLTSFLNHQEKHGRIMVEFRLAKDPTRWGVVEPEGDGESVFYVLIPPWAGRSRTTTMVMTQQQQL